MKLIDVIKQRVKNEMKTIVLPEASDIRTLKAARITTDEGFAKVILVGDYEECKRIADNNNIDISDIEFIDPKSYEDSKLLIDTFYELRKSKGMTLEAAKDIIMNNYLYFGCMLVYLGRADGQVSGAIHSTADTLRPALQIIKTKPEISVASTLFLVDVPNCEYGNNGIFLYADCGMIQNPTSEELVEIAKASADSYKLLTEDDAVIAFLSHSTFGTSKCSDVDKVSEATRKFKEKYPDYTADGELQFDAAVVPEVAKKKAPNSNVAGKANVLVFPDLDSGNIAYKITERLAKADTYGPITQGLKKPCNDLSRGCNELDIVGVIAITALQSL